MMQQGQPLQIALTGWCRQSELRDNSVRSLPENTINRIFRQTRHVKFQAADAFSP